MLIVVPAWAAGGRYDPDYPFCMEVVDTSGGRLECSYESYEQCRQVTFGAGGTCFKNPNYVPRPVESTPPEAAPVVAEPPEPIKSKGRYDPNYPVCMEAVDTSGGRLECSYTTYEQCRQATFGSGGTCFKNPSYVQPPPQPAAAQAEPAPPAKPAKPKKSTKSAKSPQAPPSPQHAQSR